MDGMDEMDEHLHVPLISVLSVRAFPRVVAYPLLHRLPKSPDPTCSTVFQSDSSLRLCACRLKTPPVPLHGTSTTCLGNFGCLQRNCLGTNALSEQRGF